MCTHPPFLPGPVLSKFCPSGLSVPSGCREPLPTWDPQISPSLASDLSSDAGSSSLSLPTCELRAAACALQSGKPEPQAQALGCMSHGAWAQGCLQSLPGPGETVGEMQLPGRVSQAPPPLCPAILHSANRGERYGQHAGGHCAHLPPAHVCYRACGQRWLHGYAGPGWGGAAGVLHCPRGEPAARDIMQLVPIVQLVPFRELKKVSAQASGPGKLLSQQLCARLWVQRQVPPRPHSRRLGSRQG